MSTFKIVNVKTKQQEIADDETRDLFWFTWRFGSYQFFRKNDGWKRVEESVMFKVGDKVVFKDDVDVPSEVKETVFRVRSVYTCRYSEIVFDLVSDKGECPYPLAAQLKDLKDLKIYEEPKQQEKAMKFEIYDEQQKEKEPVRLKLFKRMDGGITVQAVNPYGEKISNLVTFDNLVIGRIGRICLHAQVCPDLGFQLDDAGRVVVDK
jgi:hypothetical protein